MNLFEHNSKYYSGEEFIGDVPTNWDVKPLYTLFRNIQNKNVGNKENNVLSLSYGRIVRRDLESNYGLLPESFETYQIVEPNDIILRLTDLQNDKRSLRVGLVQEKGIITSAYVNLRPGKELLPRYAYYLLHNYDICKIFYNLGSGVRQSMNYVDLKKLTFLVPPITEQKKIVDYLDSEVSMVNNFIEKKQKLIELLQEKRQAIIDESVTKGLDTNAPMKDSEIAWLGNVPAHWAIKKLKFLTKITVGIVVNPSHYYRESGVPCLRSFNVKELTLNDSNLVYISPKDNVLLKKSMLNKGDLVSIRTGNAGITAVVDDRFNGANCIDLIIIKKSQLFDSLFLAHVLNSSIAKKQYQMGSEGAIQQHFNIETAKNLSIPYPPLEEQYVISIYLNDKTTKIDELILKVQTQIENLKEYRQSLISEAVTGKIDVREMERRSCNDHRLS